MPRSFQLSPRSHSLQFFLDKLDGAHGAIATRSSRQVLHYHAATRSLVPWFWPVYDEEFDQQRGLHLRNARVEPSALEEYRRHHKFRAPSCLCSLVDGTEYTESRIGVLSGGDRGGVYVAECADAKCGYRVYLDDFYSALGLRIKKFDCRGVLEAKMAKIANTKKTQNSLSRLA
ncbi:hypothetical protein BKA70DRAFT_883304 [Coprinopsis sp. MPI-PUGE-AT-0042]|nr:hypothetical protein BKA70DRAFT_883304 [Coprinopsis sp. MPI-PUGE-AT-0042]